LRSASFGIPPVEAVFDKYHRIAKTCPAHGFPIRVRYFEMIGDHGHQHRQIKIAAEAPSEIEITFVRKRGACRQGNIRRRVEDPTAGGENRVVGD
jgi:hypothetical protein